MLYRILFGILFCLTLGLSLTPQTHAQETAPMANPASNGASTGVPKTAYAFSFTGIDGKPMPLSAYKGKVVLIVNTASHCGFAPQYNDLQELAETYGPKGLVVLGIPSDDFADQEIDNPEGIKAFTQEHFHITFPLASITHVRGDDASPFYKWAAAQVGFLGTPKWNFHKYLIDRQGHLAGWYSTITRPTAPKVVAKIEQLLAQQAE